MILKMKRQRSKNHKDKKFNTPDIIRNLKCSKSKIKLPTARVYNDIVEDYLEMMHSALLHGYEWTLPVNLGKICIHKSSMEEKPAMIKEVMRNAENKNIGRKGFSYSIDISSEHLKKNAMTFKPSSVLQKKLKHALNRTTQDYRFKPKTI